MTGLSGYQSRVAIQVGLSIGLQFKLDYQVAIQVELSICDLSCTIALTHHTRDTHHLHYIATGIPTSSYIATLLLGEIKGQTAIEPTVTKLNKLQFTQLQLFCELV